MHEAECCSSWTIYHLSQITYICAFLYPLGTSMFPLLCCTNKQGSLTSETVQPTPAQIGSGYSAALMCMLHESLACVWRVITTKEWHGRPADTNASVNIWQAFMLLWGHRLPELTPYPSSAVVHTGLPPLVLTPYPSILVVPLGRPRPFFRPHPHTQRFRAAGIIAALWTRPKTLSTHSVHFTLYLVGLY